MVVWIGLCATLAPAPALAKKLDELLKAAEVRFRLADFKGALSLYEEAFRAKADPRLHFEIGQCHRYLKNHEKALFHYRLYLREVENPDKKDETEHLIRMSEEQLAPVTTTSQSVAIPARSPPPPPRVDRVEPRPRRMRSALLWTGVGMTAALLVTGTVTFSISARKSDEFKDLSTPRGDLQALKESGEALRTAGLVTFALGAATGVATTLYYFLGRPTDEQVGVAPVPGGALVVWKGEL